MTMSRQTPSLSFEVFPPNPAVGNDKIISALQDMRELTPHFISVTASNNKFNIKETTVRLADFIQNDLAIPTIAHLPAIYLTKEKVAETIADLIKLGYRKSWPCVGILSLMWNHKRISATQRT